MTDSKFIAAAIIAAIVSAGTVASAQPTVASAQPTTEHAEQAIRGGIFGIPDGSLIGPFSLLADQRQCVRVNTFSETGRVGFTVGTREYYTIDFALSVSYLQECMWPLYRWGDPSIRTLGGSFGGTINELIGAEYDRRTTEDTAPIIDASVVRIWADAIFNQHRETSEALPDRDTFIEEVKTTLADSLELSQSAVDDITLPSAFPSGFVGGREGSDQDLTGQVVFHRDPQHDRDWVVLGVRPLP